MSSLSLEEQKSEILAIIENVLKDSQSKKIYDELINPLQAKFGSKPLNFIHTWNIILLNLEKIKMNLLQNEPFSPNYVLQLLYALKKLIKIEDSSYEILRLESSSEVYTVFINLRSASESESTTGNAETLNYVIL